MASWFACEWPETAETWGADRVWDDDLEQYTEVRPGEWLYWVFEGMPMGWSWALYFCQATLESAAEKATPGTPDGHGGLCHDGGIAPIVSKGHPVSAIYVDNVLVAGIDFADAEQGLL